MGMPRRRVEDHGLSRSMVRHRELSSTAGAAGACRGTASTTAPHVPHGDSVTSHFDAPRRLPIGSSVACRRAPAGTRYPLAGATDLLGPGRRRCLASPPTSLTARAPTAAARPATTCRSGQDARVDGPTGLPFPWIERCGRPRRRAGPQPGATSTVARRPRARRGGPGRRGVRNRPSSIAPPAASLRTAPGRARAHRVLPAPRSRSGAPARALAAAPASRPSAPVPKSEIDIGMSRVRLLPPARLFRASPIFRAPSASRHIACHGPPRGRRRLRLRGRFALYA
jgi:hypothetical protein